MGNNGSRSGHISSLETEPTWTHSFPKSPHGICQQHKVLPEKILNKKLRSTNNGEILQAGGTISGRQFQEKTLSLERENKPFKIFRTNSVSSNPSDDHKEFIVKPYPRSYISNHGVTRYAAQRLENNNIYKEQIKKYGSEPDLRNHSSRNDSGRYKGKKKYRAPPPPNHGALENSNLNCYQWNENVPDLLTRRCRLFKTKTDLQKRCSSPINQPLDLQLEKAINKTKLNACNNDNVLNVELRNHSRKDDKNNRLSLPEINRTEFQAELMQAVRSSKSTKINKEKQNDIIRKYDKKSSEQIAKMKIKTLDHNINKIDHMKSKLKLLDLNTLDHQRNILNTYSDRSHHSDKVSILENNNELLDLEKKEKPSKLFYFGMKEPIRNNLNKTDNNDVNLNDFAHTFQSYNEVCSLSHLSGSDLSSELEMEESQVSTNKIALQLRPILPKKQLDIPRFSPATAWKQLSAVESNYAPSSVNSDDFPMFMEDRIQKLSRPPPPLVVQTGPRSNYDKSGDSGISGDAGPIGFDDSPDGIVDIRNGVDVPLDLHRNQGMSWTPQQDLGEEESSTDEETQKHNQIINSALVKFTPNPNVFSLSLPRDNQLSSYINRNFKNKIDDISNSFMYQRGNWFLSKSAPNSLNNGLNSEIPNSQKIEEPKQVSSTVQNVSRVMYLPESDNTNKKHQNSQTKTERPGNQEAFYEEFKDFKFSKFNHQTPLSKSFENITTQVNCSVPEDLQDPPTKKTEPLKIYKPKRFTFQSTIRQIERKRLAERLSKEAEKKEKQRLSELAAMQKVEEEFQRKRAREKACIRQQLRLFSLDDTVWSNAPSEEVKDVPTRSDPDGAVSSTASSPVLPLGKKVMHPSCISEEHPERNPKKNMQLDMSDECVKKTQMTLILSEYRQPQREYKDFRGTPRYMVEFVDSNNTKQTTIHPQVTYNIPKASNSQTEGCSNYRKQFAHGVKSSRSGDSSYSDDSQSIKKNNSPKACLNKRMPVSRF